jgi:cytochrome c peroxidase
MLKWQTLRIVSGGLFLVVSGCGMDNGDVDESVTEARSNLEPGGNDYGVAETFHTAGTIDFTNPFFQALGTNPRTCMTCHNPDQGWTMTSAANKQLFKDTDGLAPLFNLVDEGTSPNADISTKKARKATFMPNTIDLAVTRFTRNIPATAQFTVAPEDPSGFSTPTQVLNFHRPTATANESKVSSITNTSAPTQDIQVTLANLMRGAAQLHEQRDPATPVPVDQQNAGRDFMFGIFFAQIIDNQAGRLDAGGALGGPTNISTFPFMLGMNDPMQPGFNPKVFNIFDAWEVFAVNGGQNDCEQDAKAAIYRGQEVFNFNQFTISGVPGFTDLSGTDVPIQGTCSTCHNTPNVGGHSVIRMVDIGTADEPNCSPGLPILAVTRKSDTTQTRRICDMGRGGNGVWADLAKFRIPPLRGLAARAPYFHDGQAKNIRAAVRYHEDRFNIDLSHGKRKDLEAFLGAL